MILTQIAWAAVLMLALLWPSHALSALDGEHSPEIPIAVAVIRDVRARVGELGAQFDALGAACHEYADHVDAKRSELRSLLEDLAEELVVGAIVAAYTLPAAQPMNCCEQDDENRVSFPLSKTGEPKVFVSGKSAPLVCGLKTSIGPRSILCVFQL